jgi:hypothetical protein
VNPFTFDLRDSAYGGKGQPCDKPGQMKRVVLTVSNGEQREILEYSLEPNQGEHPLACLVALRGAVFLTGCPIGSARVIEDCAEWVAPLSLLESLNWSLA